MKIHIFLVIIFLVKFNFILSAQFSSLNAVEYVIESKLNSPDLKGTYKLYFNDAESVFINTSMPKADEYVENGTQISVRSGEPDGQPIYIKGKTVQMKYRLLSSKNPCIVTDSIVSIKWKIAKETKFISKYKAQKATGEFGGRTYDVWFTNEIPISVGPHKLRGLPGLILEAHSTDGKISIHFKSYETKCNDGFVIKPLQEYIKVPTYTYLDYKERKLAMFEKKAIAMKAQGVEYKLQDKSVDWQIEKDYF